MVLMAAGAIIGAGAQIFSAIKQSQAASLQAAIAMRNTQSQERMQRELMALQKAGREDIRGNRTEFIPGRGFVTTAEPLTASLIRAQDLEQRERLTGDASIRRGALQRGDALSKALAPVATRESLRFSSRTPVSEGAVVGDLEEQGLRGVKEGFRRAGNTIGRTLTRLGDSSTAGKFAANTAEAQGRAEGDVRINARVQGRPLAEALESSKTQRLGNTALSFNNAASRVPDSPFIPQSIDATTVRTQARQAGDVNRAGLIGGSLTNQASGMLSKALQFQSASQPSIFKTLGTGFGNLFGGLSAIRDDNLANRQRGSTFNKLATQ